MEETHILGILVEDRPGVLARISGMFARRDFNIDTITVGKTNQQGISKMIISMKGDQKTIEQVKKQVNKIVDVIKVSELGQDESIISELCLIKIAIKNVRDKQELIKYSEIYKAKITDLTPKSIILQIIGTPKKVDSLINLVKSYGIREISRTGITAMSRGHAALSVKEE